MAEWPDVFYPEPPSVPGVPDALAGVAEQAEQEAYATDWPPPHWTAAPEDEPVEADPFPVDREPTTAELFGAAYQAPEPAGDEALEPVPEYEPEPEPEVVPSFAPGVATFDQWARGETERAEQRRKAADVEQYGQEMSDARDKAAAMSDEDLAAAEVYAQHEAERRKAKEIETLAQRKQQEEADALKDKEESRKRTIEKLEALNQQWEELASQKIDTERWWSNRSTGQKASNYIAAAFSGFLNPGGENQAIKGMQQAIDRDIAAQREDIANGRASLQARGNLVSQMYSITGDLETAQDAARIAMYNAAEQEILARAAQFDPNGTAARRAQMAARKVQGDKAAAQAALEEKQYNREQAHLKAEREWWKDQEDARYKRGQLAEQRAARIEARKAREAAEKARKAAEDDKLTKEQLKEARELGVTGRKGRHLINNDGSVFLAPTIDEAKKVRAKKATLDNMSKLIDELESLEPSGSFASLRGDKARRLKSIHTQLKMEVKNAQELGALTDSDLDLVNDQLGKDVTEFRGATMAPMLQFRSNSIDKFNSDLNSLGYSGPRYEPIPTASGTSKPTEALEALEEHERPTSRASSIVLPGAAPLVNKAMDAADKVRRQKSIDSMASKALEGNAEAREYLQNLADEGNAAAKDALDYVARGGRRLVRSGGGN